MSRKIPDRWLDYAAVGKRLDGTRFIAFKVPLKQSLSRQLPRADVFGPWELLDVLRRDDQELRLIVDLTFTTRYYSVQDLPSSLQFVKIFTKGHEVPSDATILSFKRAVRRFLKDNADNDTLVGVHCTHGLNRTGYLICRYLIDVDGMDPHAAVKLFNSSRGHDIERQNYVDDLRCGPRRSNVGMEESEQEPQTGSATRRPSDGSDDCGSREERRAAPPGGDSSYHRSFPPRGTNHRSHHHHRPPHGGFLPDPPPRLHPPTAAPLPHNQWTHPHHGNQWNSPAQSEQDGSRYPPGERQWRSPPQSEGGRSRYPTVERQWRRPPHSEGGGSRYPPGELRQWRTPAPRSQQDRRGPLPPPQPRYSPRWAHESAGCDGAEDEWAEPKPRHTHRHTHGLKRYDH
ncbi:RNA/RNP complex-1-interacting phosphatase-like [Scophthalmus maximus]|uniref:RNA/RNP complex-1-interacting phosphatase-like n=1 Tax=Scophthalmus maximus TaxID=52904 RepID=UPI000F39EFCD|nr:RNA/RNP complex-1-interacting phosphatase-like [Scophthalmus maximus]